jgi:nitrogen fixation/metabolism regulation signal transduction histidine kinase
MQARLEAQDRDLQRLLAVSSTLLVACVVAGVVLLTHRSAGPVRRVQNHMKRIAAGDLDHTVTLRRGDHFKSLADDFNVMIRALRRRAQQDVVAIERLAQHARTNGDPHQVAADLEHLAHEKRAALPT